MRILSAIMFATSLITGCAVGDEEVDDTIGENGEPIIGGSVDYGDPAVGMVRSPLTGKVTSWGVCTATLISPTVLVSAAHCVQPTALWVDVSFATTPNSTAPFNTGGWIPAQIIQSPLWTGNLQNGHDTALVILTKPVFTTPLKRGPTPANGTAVKAIGYGVNSFQQTGTGTKRHIVLGVSASNVHEFTAGQEGNNVCHGDSGGPVVQNGRIVGTSDYVDTPDCHGAGHFVRLDDNLPFIRSFVPGF